MGPRNQRHSSVRWGSVKPSAVAGPAILVGLLLGTLLPGWQPGNTSMPQGDLTAIVEAEGEQFQVAFNPLTGALFLRYLPEATPRLVELLESYGAAEEGGVRVSTSSALHPNLSPPGDRASLSQTLAYLDRRIDASLATPTPGRLYEVQFAAPSTVDVEEVLRGETPVPFRRALDSSGEPDDIVYAYDRAPLTSPPGDVIIFSSHSQGGYQDYYVLGDDWDNPAEPGNDDLNGVMFRDWTAAAYGSIRVPNWAHTSSNVSIAAYGKIKVYLDEVENGYSFNENTFTGADRVYYLTRGQVLTLGDQDRIVPGSIGISGQDRIFTAGAPAFMVHGAWPFAFCNDPNCPQSGFWIQGVIAAELWPQFPRISQQTAYVTPMGWEPGAVDTQYTYLIVQAFLDNTVVKINDPTTIQNPDAKVTLNKGGVYVYGHYDSSTGGLLRPAPGTQV
ncbi:MAG TPA: hypothetical protein VI893_01845, partial [Thermoplasmata archaeon]|nr:hypothetical protein [Thermoplasmata archaeon]